MSLSITPIYWVRHAPVKAIMPGRIYGQRDVGCTLKDVERLKALANTLPQEAVWITSSLSRTKKTARAIAEQRHETIKPLAYKELMEQNFGLWQSKTWDELDDDPMAQSFWDDPASHRPPDGESFTEVCKRVHNCINHLVRKFSGQPLICVAHAGTIRAALAQALDIPPRAALNLQIDTLSLSRIDHIYDPVRGNGHQITYINRI